MQLNLRQLQSHWFRSQNSCMFILLFSMQQMLHDSELLVLIWRLVSLHLLMEESLYEPIPSDIGWRILLIEKAIAYVFPSEFFQGHHVPAPHTASFCCGLSNTEKLNPQNWPRDAGVLSTIKKNNTASSRKTSYYRSASLEKWWQLRN